MIFLDIWRSYRSLPIWVQVWVAFVLVPVNFASLLFLSDPMGIGIAFLAVGAIAPNIGILFYERGFSKMMAMPHVLPWTLLVIWLLFAMPQGSMAFVNYLWILLVVDAISLAFDFPDARKWWKGDRAVAGTNVMRT